MKYSESLKKNRDFQQVYKRGTSNANRYLVMYVLPNQHMKNRLGISVSKKVGNSVEIESAFINLAQRHEITGEFDEETSY